MSLGSQSHFTIGMFTYGSISHEAKGVSHGKEDAAVLSVHTCFTGECLREVQSHTKTLAQGQSSHNSVGPTTVLGV